MSASVYVETTIISYLASKPSRDLIVAAHQQITLEWWSHIRPQVSCFISPFIIQEISAGDQDAVRRRQEYIKDIPILQVNNEIQQLARLYYEELTIPNKARLDAAHLAIAVWYEMDYLLSWNCKHIVSGRTRKVLEKVNSRLQIRTPVLCTPEELMEV